MSDLSKPLGRIITFYSYKGGTGRSMGVANVAWLLALSGFKVLVIDWDLEAPGLHRYFRPFLSDPELSVSTGVIDFANDFVIAASERASDTGLSSDWYKPYSNLLGYAKELEYDFPQRQDRDEPGRLDFVPAGRQDSAYSANVNSFNWKHFIEKLNGHLVLQEAREEMRKVYDYVLIDSRTGVSDTSGICTVLLPDDIVVCFTLNLQSILGASQVAASILEERKLRGQATQLFPIPMRVQLGEKIKTRRMKDFAKPRFLPLLPPAMSEKEKDKYWDQSDIPHDLFYSFEENLAYFRDPLNSTNTVLAAMKLLAGRLIPEGMGELPEISPTLLKQITDAYDGFDGATPATATIAALPPAIYILASPTLAPRDLAGFMGQPGLEVLIPPEGGDRNARRESLRRALRRSAKLIVPVSKRGLTGDQREMLLMAAAEAGLGGLKADQAWVVLFPGAEPEKLSRLLLPLAVADLRSAKDPASAIPNLVQSPPPAVEHIPVSPYPGLTSFTGDDCFVFTGREELVQHVADVIITNRVVAIVGPPRSGKRSLVQAGLLPYLSQLGVNWEIRIDLSPSPQLESFFKPTQDVSNPGASARPLLLIAAAAAITRSSALFRTPAANSFTGFASGSPTEAAPGISPTSPAARYDCLLVLAEGTEEVAACERALGTNALRIEMQPLSAAQLARAINTPAITAGGHVGQGLAERIAQDLENQPDPLPLLQYIASELWAAGDPKGELTETGYKELGGVNMVEIKCEAAFSQIAEEQRPRCLWALARLAFPIVGAALDSANQMLLEPFIQSRVLSVDAQDGAATPTAETIAATTSARQADPPALVRFSDKLYVDRWPRLLTFLQQNRDSLVFSRRLANAFRTWQWSPPTRHDFLFLRGEELAEAQRQTAAHPEALSGEEREFIQRSAAKADAETQQRTLVQSKQKKKSASVWAAVVAIIALGAATYGYFVQQRDREFIRALQTATTRYSQGDYLGAMVQYQTALSIRPGDGQALKGMGMVDAALSQFEQALDYFNQAVAVSPNDVDLLQRRDTVKTQLARQLQPLQKTPSERPSYAEQPMQQRQTPQQQAPQQP